MAADGGKFLTMFCVALMIPGMLLMMILLQLTQTTSGYHQYLPRKSTETTKHALGGDNVPDIRYLRISETANGWGPACVISHSRP